MVIKVIFIIYLLILSVYDIKEREISLYWLLIGAVLDAVYLINNICTSPNDALHLLSDTLCGCVPGLILIILSVITSSIGKADGVVLLYFGIFWGIKYTLWVMVISLTLVFVLSAVLLILRLQSIKFRIPYIPFLTLSVLITCLA